MEQNMARKKTVGTGRKSGKCGKQQRTANCCNKSASAGLDGSKTMKTRKSARAKETAKKILTEEERFKLIEKEAYLLAEKNGFGGDPKAYWFAAEKEISEKFPIA